MSATVVERRVLSDTLRELDDDQIAELFRLRGDLLNPLPLDLGQLASRATTKASLARVLDRLNRFEIAVLEAVAISDDPVDEDRVRALLGGAEVQAVDATLRRLRDLVLLWGPSDDLQIPGEAVALLGPHPAGLGPPGGPATPDGQEAIDDALEAAGAQARTLAERLAAGPPVGRFGGRSDHAVQSVLDDMLERGLLVRVDAGTVGLPREVGLRLRGDRLLPPEDLAEPPVSGKDRDAGAADRAASGTALEVVRRVEQLLEEFGREPPARLKAGGLGVRDLRRVASRLEVDEPTAALLLQVAQAAGLLKEHGGDEDGTGRSSSPRWLPTVSYDQWLESDPAKRWADLVRAWLYDTEVTGLVGSRDDKDRPRNALSGDLKRPAAPEMRALVLRTLARSDPGTVVTAEVVRAHLRWRRPRRANAFFEDFVSWTIDESAALGLTGLGVLGAAGRVLAESGEKPDEIASSLRPLLPEPVQHVLLQADLTAVAPGPLTPETARTLAAMADAESHGGATVYRFSAKSIRRALDAGWTAADLTETLGRLSSTPVPQPLAYLVQDSARRHGQLRSGGAAAYLRCDDVTTLDAVMADKRAADLGLRRLAPTVVISPRPAVELVAELRALGYEPVAEASDGALLAAGPEAERAPAGQGPSSPREEGAPEPRMVDAAVRAVRAGERARNARPGEPTTYTVGRTDSAEAMRLLRSAAAEGWTVWVGYADQHGGTTERVLDPLHLEAGNLTAYDHAAGVTRRFLLHRITGVARLDAD